MIPLNQLVKELWDASEEKCPYVSYNGERCCCKAVDSEIVCDAASLQLWCLAGRARYQLCHFFPQEFPEGELFWASGPLCYSRGPGEFYKLIVEIDREITDYYCSLIPKYTVFNRQAYAPHVSVVRREVPPNLALWGKHEGRDIKFAYSNIVHFGPTYCWLNIFSNELEDIRTELGLPVSTEYTRPPDGYTKCFHTTLGNFKNL